jgi:hypothetical protein
VNKFSFEKVLEILIEIGNICHNNLLPTSPNMTRKCIDHKSVDENGFLHDVITHFVNIIENVSMVLFYLLPPPKEVTLNKFAYYLDMSNYLLL